MVTFTKLHRGSVLHIQPSHKHDYVPTVVEHPLLSTALRHLLLLLLFDLGGLRLDLAGTGERAVNCSASSTTEHFGGTNADR